MSTPTQKLIRRTESVIAGVKFVTTTRLRLKYGYECREMRWYVDGKQVVKRQFIGEVKAAQDRAQ